MSIGFIFLLSVAFTVLTVLFLGPGMWSSSTETFLGMVWRRLRGRPAPTMKDPAEAPPPAQTARERPQPQQRDDRSRDA